MADALKPVDRPSLTNDVEKKYSAGGNFGQGAAKAGTGTVSARTPLQTTYENGSNFALGAKKAGPPANAATNFIDTGNVAQNEFRPFAVRGVTSFQPAALNYATTQYRLSTVKYRS